MNENINLEIDNIFNLAVKNHLENKIDIAQSLYEKVLKINPNHSRALNNLGILSFNLNKNDKAIECFQKAIDINPLEADAYNNLGTIFKNLNKFEKAIKYFEKAIEINPSQQDAHNNLGIIYKELKEYKKALKYIKKSIEINSDNEKFINPLSFILTNYTLKNQSIDDIKSLRELFLILYKNNHNDHNNIFKNSKNILFYFHEKANLISNINDDKILDNKVVKRLLKDELLHLMLQKSLIWDKFLENILTKIRSKILQYLNTDHSNDLNEYLEFFISLAEQSWLNEYIYNQSSEEIEKVNNLKAKIEGSDEIDENEISILGSYMPLNYSKIIKKKLLNYISPNISFNNLINVQIKEPLREKELIKSIKSLNKIKDDVSKKVRKQYEENPYPRWKHTYKIIPDNFVNWLNKEIKPNKIEFDNEANNMDVLVAGCGTGSHILGTTRYKNAKILGIDLSLASLGYAKRKVEELGIKNVEFMHADILQLELLNKKFDIIESAGTLHHMKDPIRGFKVLYDILKPNGFLRVGLYSEIARMHIIEAREIIKKKNILSSNQNIKNFRQEIINGELSKNIQKSKDIIDFYSLSMVRDLFFHIQEHQFTIPQISKMIHDFNLEFLGFYIKDSVKKNFSRMFPKDLKNVSLDNWNQFEKDNPDSFINMYQFWMRKK
tara:strand:+ start:703 stop:2700 length:1998 start_codon:yes stop_codon:yes gene_type:complete